MNETVATLSYFREMKICITCIHIFYLFASHPNCDQTMRCLSPSAVEIFSTSVQSYSNLSTSSDLNYCWHAFLKCMPTTVHVYYCTDSSFASSMLFFLTVSFSASDHCLVFSLHGPFLPCSSFTKCVSIKYQITQQGIISMTFIQTQNVKSSLGSQNNNT